MPLSPILSREAFFDTLRDGTLRDLDWNLVETSLGAMLEPRQLSVPGIIDTTSGQVEVDPRALSVNRRVPFDEDQLFVTFFTAGPQLPVNFNA